MKQLKQTWKTVSLNDFVELHELKDLNYDSVLERYIDVLELMSDMDIEEVEDLPPHEVVKLVNQLKFLKTAPSLKHQTTIDDLTLIKFNKLTWGEFIDLEYYRSQGYFSSIPTIAGILYKRMDKDKWGHLEIEPYNYDPIERGSLFKPLPIEIVYGAVIEYYKFRDDLIDNKYRHLFVSEDEEQEEVLTSEDKKAIEREKRIRKRKYQKLTYDLAGGDMNKMRDIFKLPLIFVLNMLAMHLDLQE